MRHPALWLLSFAASVASPAFADNELIKGQWAREDGRSRVEIKRCGLDWCAVNLWIKPGTKDEKAGDVLIMSLKPESDTVLSGSAYDPQRKLIYSLRIRIEADTLTTEGCLVRVFCRSVRWSKI